MGLTAFRWQHVPLVRRIRSSALCVSCFLPRPRTQDMNTGVVTMNA
eukprot:COSAG01_NODE_19270_length_1020_cov_1.508143_1_plen_45_part_01